MRKQIRAVIETIPKKKKKEINFFKHRFRKSGLHPNSSQFSTSHVNSDDVTDRIFLTSEIPVFRREQFHVTWDGFTEKQQLTLNETKGNFIEILEGYEKELKEQIVYTDEVDQIRFEDLYRNAKIFAKALRCIEVSVKQPGVLIMLRNGIHQRTASLGVMLSGMTSVYVHNGASIEMLKLIINKANIRICLLDQTTLQYSDLWDMFDVTIINVDGIYKEVYEPYEVKGISEIKNGLRHNLTRKIGEVWHSKQQIIYGEGEEQISI